MKIFLETERLILRELLPSDAKDMAALDFTPNILQNIGIQPANNLEDSKKTIQYIRDQYERNGIGRWAVVRKDTFEFIGRSGLKYVEAPINGHQNYYDLGYKIIEKYWGLGYGYEAAQAVVNYGFDNLGLLKICAYLDATNIASRRILEKCGLQFVATFEEDGVLCHWMEIKNN